jgi:hypothetical protein
MFQGFSRQAQALLYMGCNVATARLAQSNHMNQRTKASSLRGYAFFYSDDAQCMQRQNPT